MNKLSIEEVNKLTEAEFVSHFRGLFNSELCVPIISKVAKLRKFSDSRDFLNGIFNQFDRTDFDKILNIIRDNDILGVGLSKLSGSAKKEQKEAGIHQLSEYDFLRFEALNKAYKAKFSFNFICVVKGLSKEQILRAFEKRISNDFETEFLFSITQLKKLVYFRLLEKIEFTDNEKEKCYFKHPREYDKYIM
jgi:OHCU decarboxylase